MPHTRFTEEELRRALTQYKSHAKELSARTLSVNSFWAEESRMLSEFPETFQEAGCIPERKNLKCLSKWKWAGLWANHAHKNTREEVRTITGDAFGMSSDDAKPSSEAVRRQLRRLCDLVGVSAATGAVLLTFWRPDVYTVMDQRALASLASADLWTGASEANIDDYPIYLEKCHSISEETGLSLRDTDRALWYLGD